MTGHTDFTVVVGLDKRTLEQWSVSLPTVAALRPELLERPWTIFYDFAQISANDVLRLAEAHGLDSSPHLRFVPWPTERVEAEYASQRAKMLAGFVHVPGLNVSTPWWMKLDTDVIASPTERPWVEAEWFADDVVLVASPWGYGKAKGDSRTIEQWCLSLESWGDIVWPTTQRLGLEKDIRGSKLVRPRFWSPVSYYRRDWTKRISELCVSCYGIGGMPVPSQDTVHWYAAERTGAKYLTVNMKRHGWTFTTGINNLRRMAGAVLKEHAILRGATV